MPVGVERSYPRKRTFVFFEEAHSASELGGFRINDLLQQPILKPEGLNSPPWGSKNDRNKGNLTELI